ncbi:MAG: hypothetical protein RLY40_760 [Pseudomonadota bacterium]|jgi:hypothetical protein
MFSIVNGLKKSFISGVVQVDIGVNGEKLSDELIEEVDERFFGVRSKLSKLFFLNLEKEVG